MSYFTSIQAARDWASTYGYSYSFRVMPAEDGLFLVHWNYREPRGV